MLHSPHQSARTRRSWFGVGVFFTLWMLLLVAGRSKLFHDPGTFWHLVLGHELLAGGELTRCDGFTFTFDGRPWLALQWLGECAMAVAYSIGGWDTLLLISATVLAATYSWLASRLVRGGLHPLPAVFVLAMVLAASSHHFHARPHLATIVLMGVTVAWLCDVESRRASPARLWWLVPLFAVWTNMHGGVLGGLATVGMAVAGWFALAALGGGPMRSRARIVHVLVLCAAMAAALFVNPYGMEMPRAWLRIMSMPLPALIQEHRPLSLWRPEGIMAALLGAGYVLLLWDAARTRYARRNRRGQGQRRKMAMFLVAVRSLRVTWLLPLVWLLLAVMRVRHAPLFAITAGVALADLLPHTRLAHWLAEWDFFTRPVRGPKESRRSPSVILPPFAAVCIALAIQMANAPVPVMGRGWARLDERRWPVALLPDLKRLEQAADVQSHRIFNALDYGGFVTFFTPGLKTFIDDRCELFGGKFLSAYATAEVRQPSRIHDWARRFDFPAALVRTGSPFDQSLSASGDWKPIRRTATATLYRRTDGRENE